MVELEELLASESEPEQGDLKLKVEKLSFFSILLYSLFYFGKQLSFNCLIFLYENCWGIFFGFLASYFTVWFKSYTSDVGPTLSFFLVVTKILSACKEHSGLFVHIFSHNLMRNELALPLEDDFDFVDQFNSYFKTNLKHEVHRFCVFAIYVYFALFCFYLDFIGPFLYDSLIERLTSNHTSVPSPSPSPSRTPTPSPSRIPTPTPTPNHHH